MASEDTQPTPTDRLNTPEAARKWLDVIARYDRTFEKWRERVRRILKVYTDSRTSESAADLEANRRKFNLYWANIKTLQPSLYQKLPQPSVSRRFKDDDRVARVAGEMVERAVTFNWDKGGFDAVMRQVRDDFLHAARAQVWVRYVPTLEGNMIKEERVAVDYVNWADFGHNVARDWSEVTAVWRRVYMTRQQLIDRFGKEKGALVGLDHKPDAPTDNVSGDTTIPRDDKATVYEIWDKVTRKVFFIAKSYDKGPLEVAEPLLPFDDFYPCPRPAYGTLEGGTLIPVPDYALYQDQLEEIDELTIRMGRLLDALKLVGFYPSSSEEASEAIKKALTPGVENVLIPIPAFGEFKDGGGVNGKLEWLPVDQVAKVLQACWEARKQLIDDVFQITGISDIMRGDTDAQETASAQRIKSQWGSIRIRDQQYELARFARDVARLVAEVVCDRFQPATLMAMTNMRLPTDQQVQQMIMEAQAQAQAQAVAQQPPAPAGGPPVSPSSGGPPLPAGAPA